MFLHLPLATVRHSLKKTKWGLFASEAAESMPDIQQLAPSVVNKIAAGEVIERPASVVKELMENAVDACATRVDVEIEQGGSELVRVCDNGEGIAADQLRLAVASHATSKIRDAEDLFRVETLGFRGEALASIAEVAALRLRSRRADAEAGAELEVVGGRLEREAPCGGPVGTMAEARNLFFNTPVRRKFLRSAQTEMGHSAEAFARIALAHHHTHFTLRHNDRLTHELPPVDSWRDRLAALFGAELADALIAVESRDEHVRLFGYVADPRLSRANNRMQYLFLNGRHIRDRSLQHALAEAYRGLLPSGRFPIAFLRLELPPDSVDVNVHPTKLEVRFHDGGRIYSHILGAVRRKFLTTDLTVQVQVAPPFGPDFVLEGARIDSRAIAQRPLVQLPLPDAGASSRPCWIEGPPSAPAPAMRGPAAAPLQPAAGEAGGAPRSPTAAAPPPSPTGLQLHDRYLVTENEEGMLVIDQHALHERILYEQLREKVLSGRVETQSLLVPEPVTLTPAEAAAAFDARQTLAQLGIEIEPFGGDTVLVRAYPAMLANLNPGEVVRQVVEQLLEGSKAPDRRDLLDRLLHSIACKAAIKAGDRLSPEEVSALLRQRHLCQDAHHCPHGRPAALVLTKQELDKRFLRI